MDCKYRSSSQYSDRWVFAGTKSAVLVLIGFVFSGCAGYEQWQAMRAEKVAQGERLQHIIHSYRVCLHANYTHSTLLRIAPFSNLDCPEPS